MTRLMLTICVEWDEKRPVGKRGLVKRHAYIAEQEADERVKDERYLLGIMERLTDADNGSTWIKGKPEGGEMAMFDIMVEVSNHGKENARYKIDYQKHNGCPAELIDDGMEIYQTIKKFGIRPTMERLRAVQKAKGAVENRSRLEVKVNGGGRGFCRENDESDKVNGFEVGKCYWAEGVDGFGHIVKTLVKVSGVMRDQHKVVFVTEQQKQPTVVRVTEQEDGSESFSHKRIRGVVRSVNLVKEEE